METQRDEEMVFVKAAMHQCVWRTKQHDVKLVW